MSFLSNPNMANIRLEELIDIEELTQLSHHFYQATGFPMGLLDLDGNVLIGIGWQKICTEFHRQNPDTLDHCRESDRSFQGNISQKKYHLHKCKNGLIDLAIPIKIEDRHVANLFFGQFYWKGEKPSEEKVKLTAKKYGFNEKAYIKASRQVPCYEKEEVEKIVDFYQSLVNMITNMGSANLKLKYNSEYHTEIYNSTAAAIFIFDVEADGIFRFRGLNPAHEKASGMKSKDVEGKTIDDLSDIIPQEAIAAIKQRYQRCVDAGAQIQYEEMIPMLGVEHWWLTTLTPIKDLTGKVVRIMGSAIEISKLKNTQQKLQDNKTNLEELVEDKQSKLLEQNHKLQEEIEEKAAIEEELRAANEELEKEVEERAAMEEELRVGNETLEEEISERKNVQQINEKLIYKLGKRVKEMGYLNKINEYIENELLDIEQVLIKIAETIPVAFRYPDKTFCKIDFKDQTYTSVVFRETEVSFRKTLYNNQTQVGHFQVYLDQSGRFNLDFLEEEINLLDNISAIVSQAITHHHTMKELASSEEKFRRFFQQIPYPLCYVDESGKFIVANNSFTTNLGYTLDDISHIEDWWVNAYPDPEYRKWVINNWSRAVEKSLETGESIKSDVYSVTCKNGNIKRIVIGGILIEKDFLATFLDVTEQEKYEQELLEAKQFTDAIINSLPGVFYMFNSKGEMVRWNHTMAEITGNTDDQMLGKLPTDFFTGDDATNIAERVSEVFKKGKAIASARLITRTGDKVPFMFTGRLLETDEDKFLIGHGTDISELTEAQDNLAESEAMLKVLLDATNDTIALIDSKGAIKKINTAGAERFKKTADELLGKNVYKLLPPDLSKSRKKLIDKTFNSGKPQIFEDTRNNWHFENRVFPIFNKNKKASLVGIFANDITQRKKTESQLIESEKRFRSFFDQGLIGMAITSPKKGWIRVNKSILEMFGYPQKELFSKSWADITHPDDQQKDEEQFQKLIKLEIDQYDLEKRFIKKNGKLVYTNLWVKSVVIDGKVDHIFALIDDITASKKAAAELQNALNFNTTVVQDSPMGKTVYNSTGQCILANNKASELVGASTEQLLKQNYKKLDSWKASGLAAAANNILKHGGTDKKEIHVKSSFGKDLWLECHFTRFFQNNEPHLLFIYLDISDNRYYQDELKESQQRFELAVEGANAGIWDWKLGTNEVFYDAQWKKHLGYEDHELKNEFATWEKLLHPNDAERMQHAVTDYLKNPEDSFIEEFRMQHKNGSFRWIRNEASCLKDEKGNIARMFGVHTDITEKKLAEEALKESEERHRMIFESVNDAILLMDPKNGIVDTNPAATRIYGYTAEEFKTIPPTQLVHPDYHMEFHRFLDTLAQGNTFIGETVDVSKEGKLINTQVMGSQIDLSNKKYFMVVIRDITSLIAAREDLKRSKEQLQLITDLIPVLVSYLKPDHSYEFVNKGYEKWFGVKAKEMVGKHAIDVVGEKAYEIVKKDLDRVFNGETIEYERMMPYKSGGVRFTQTTFLPHKIGNTVEGAIICVNDVTPLKEKENELRKLLDDLERSNKELEQFAYVASHDLQEPLRMVSSFLQLLERKYNNQLDEDGKEYIQFAVDGATRMKTLITDLLKYSRVGTRGKPFVKTNMNEVLSYVKSNLDSSIEESEATIEADHLPSTSVDESQMIQLFQNLIGNAIKFRGDKKPHITIRVNESNDDFTFSITDNGIGIESKFFDRIFVIFQRLHTSDKYPGTGIGLAVCKKIVERHQGQITLDSDLGEGSTFKIIIPKNLNNEN